jgi:hypothetical protein
MVAASALATALVFGVLRSGPSRSSELPVTDGAIALVTADAERGAKLEPPPPSPPDASGGDLEMECLRYQTEQKWADLDACADRLKASNPAAAEEYKSRVAFEAEVRSRVAVFETAIRDRNLKKGKAELDAIPTTVAGYEELKRKYDQAEASAITAMVLRLKNANYRYCWEYNDIITVEEKATKPPRVIQEAVRQLRCEPDVPPPEPPPQSPAQPPSEPPAEPPAEPCDHEALAEKGKDQYALGQLAAAFSSYQAAWNCKQDPEYAEKSFVIACNLADVGKAKLFWKRMSAAMKQRALRICARNQITEDMLDAF